MTNGEKYKTAQERADAFMKLCNETPDSFYRGVHSVLAWLDLEEEKPLPCPFCGSECRCENFGDVNKIECQNGCLCHYQSGGLISMKDAIAAHNRVAKAVRESEVK